MIMRDTVVYIPYMPRNNRVNPYLLNMIDILRDKYTVEEDLAEPFDVKRLLRTKAVFLNWVEVELDAAMKIRLLLHKLFGAEIIWVFHNRYPHDTVRDGVVCRNITWLADHSSAVMLHAKSSVRYLPHPGRNRKKVVYVPHILYEAHPKTHSSVKVRGKYGIHQDDFVFLVFGRIMPYKNIEGGIEAFRRLKFPNAKLVVAGEPSSNQYAGKLKALCEGEPDIMLELRFVSNRELEQLIDMSDVVLMPYQNASSMNSGVMIQAFSQGKPVVTFDICMARDMAPQGFLYRYRNSLEGAMKKAYENGREENKVMGERAKRFMEKNNSRDEVKRRVYAMLDKRGG